MKLSTQTVVIGAGHAGVEAALASARMGVDTVLFTLSLDAVANMPCNPSIGGTAKGHLVYEIDALGGEMGRAADKVTLQSRTLNLGKGAAVYSKRIQADRRKYQEHMKLLLEKEPNLDLKQATVTEILTEEGKAYCLEVNTLPGMTPASLLPKEAAAAGLTYPQLCEWIVQESLKQKRGL